MKIYLYFSDEAAILREQKFAPAESTALLNYSALTRSILFPEMGSAHGSATKRSR
jgi:hypothetical protein